MITLLALVASLAADSSPQGLPSGSDTAFTNPLPAQVRQRIQDVRAHQAVLREDWKSASADRRQSVLDSLGNVARQRRENALKGLSTSDRERIERKLEDLELRAASRTPDKRAKNVEFRP